MDGTGPIRHGMLMLARRVPALLVAATLGLLVTPGAAQAKDLSGHFGIGVEQSLSGITGLTARYWPLDNIGFSVTFGADIVIRDEGDLDQTSIRSTFGPIFNFATSLHANIGIALRGAVAINSVFAGSTTTSVGGGVEVPLHIEFFMSDSLSFSVEAGFLLWVDPKATTHDTDPNDTGLISFGFGSVIANAGVVYYF